MKSLAASLRPRVSVAIRRLPMLRRRSPGKRLFYPGCSLTSGDPDLVSRLYELLRTFDPAIGIWLDCCGMPLAKFISNKAAAPLEQKLAGRIGTEGIEELIVACGNCRVQFGRIAQMHDISLKITSIYDILADQQWKTTVGGGFIVHHPCPARTDSAFRESFERLTESAGIRRADRGHSGHHLACCLSSTPTARKRIASVEDRNVLTYCAHCVKRFGRELNTTHILQLLLGRTQPMRSVGILATLARYRRAKKNVSPASGQ